MKTAWEERVGKFLHDKREFAYAFKPADSGLYGGQTRLDWLAADNSGFFWMVEVKSLGMERQSLNLERDVSPGQRRALDDLAGTKNGVPLLAVGRGDTLYVYDWRQVRWRLLPNDAGQPSKLLRLPLKDAHWLFHWTGPKTWLNHQFRSRLLQTISLPDSATTPSPAMV